MGRMRQDVGMSVLRDVRKIITVTARGTRAAARGVRATASGTAKTSKFVRRTVGSARQRGGAGNVGMMRLLDLHAVSCAGDTLVAIGLAGTIFFNVPTGEARGRVALYLLVTMVPFAILAPLVGPMLDRFRHGRRYALAVTMLGRAVLAWIIADNLVGLGLYPAAFGVLALSRAYGVARSAAVPRLLPPGLGLSQAGARASVYGTFAGALVAPLGVAAFWAGPQWPLRVASIIFAAGVVVALRLPGKADSDEPETLPKMFHLPWRHRGDNGDRVLSGSLVVSALIGSACTRALYGFLLLALAFAVREDDLPTSLIGINLGPEAALGVIGGAMGLGTFASTAIGTGLRIRRPLRLQTIAFLAVAATGVLATLRFSLIWVTLFCLAAAVASGLAKLAVDASIQERVPETVRASAFAHAETLLMLAWVAGAALGLIPFDGRIGVAVATIGVVVAAVRATRVSRRLRGEVLRGRVVLAPPSPPSPPTARIPPPLQGQPGPAPAPGLTSEERARREGGALQATGPARAERAQTDRERAQTDTERAQIDTAPPGYHIFRPSPPDSGVSDPREGA
jgi:MFS family permease